MRSAVVIFSLLSFIVARAQMPVVNNFYQAPAYLNPALVGSSNFIRSNLIYRSQWTETPGAYTSTFFGFDSNIERINSGFGISAVRDRSGQALFSTSIFQLSYAYGIELNEKWQLRAGTNISYLQQRFDLDQLIFPGQLNESGELNEEQVQFPATNSTNSGIDIAVGILAFNSNSWAGLSLFEINSPSVSFTESLDHKLPIRLNFQAGYLFKPHINMSNNYTDHLDIIPQLTVDFSAIHQQYQAGADFGFKPIILSVAYRSNSTKNSSVVAESINKSFIVGMGIAIDDFRFKYLYNVSNGEKAYRATTHELAITFTYHKKQNIAKTSSQGTLFPNI